MLRTLVPDTFATRMPILPRTQSDAWRRPSIARVSLFVAGLTLASFVLPRVARAQTDWRLGGSLGYVYDEENDFIYFSAEGRTTLRDLPIEIQPRFSFQPVSGVSVLQFEINALYDLPLQKTNVIVPYAGVGIAFQKITNGGSQAAGYNLIFGAELPKVTSAVEPFAQFEYSVLENHFPNQGAIAVGVLARLP